MKLRTANQFQDAIDGDFAWRLKEIHDLRKVARREAGSERKTFIRAGVALLYAHWEGFVKCGAEAYVNYLSCKGLRYSELRTCFVALGLKKHINGVSTSGQSGTSVAAMDFILTEMESTAKFPLSESVDTESNLSSAVFQNIAGWIGVDSTPYSTKFRLLDESLLHRRNQIAHGEYLEIDLDGYFDLSDEVVGLLRCFKTDLENASTTETFRRLPVLPE